MNLHVQKNEISQLNSVLERILRSWAVIVECDLELALSFEPDDQNSSKDRIAGYDISHAMWSGLADLMITDQGRFEQRVDAENGMLILTVDAAMKIYLPDPMMELFRKHAVLDMFEGKLEYIGFLAVLEFNGPHHYDLLSYLKNALRAIKLDAFTETLLRPNAGLLLADLQPYSDWFDYAASQSESIYDIVRREQLMDDLNLVLLYLSQGGTLNFAKLTILCDVAGSLQPVRNLIQKERPELVV